jgi:hypothetical protein
MRVVLHRGLKVAIKRPLCALGSMELDPGCGHRLHRVLRRCTTEVRANGNNHHRERKDHTTVRESAQ